MDRFPVQLKNAEALGDLRDRCVVFHGVNKSGSLAMTRVIHEAYAAANRQDQFHSRYKPPQMERSQFIDRLARPAEGHSFMVDHYLYGAFDLIPGRHALVTQFRHPLPRVVSCYAWIQKRKAAEKNGAPRVSLERFVRRTGGQVHSQIMQFGLGFLPDGERRRTELSDREMLERAVEAIERDVTWFGIAELFEESIFVLAHLLGLPSVAAWKRDDRNRGRTMTWDLPPKTVALIEEVYRCDFELYAYAKKKFLERIAGIDFGPSLEAYKAACACEYKDRIL